MRLRRAILLLLLVLAEAGVLCGIVLVTSGFIGQGWDAGWRWGGIFDVGGPAAVTEATFMPIESANRVSVVNDVGKVIVRGAPGGQYGVQVTKYGYGLNESRAQKTLAQVVVKMERTADGVRIVADAPDHWGGRIPHADLELTLPSATAVQVGSSMGAVELTGLTAGATIDANMGSVNVVDVKGDIKVEAKMGKVDLRNVTVADVLQVEANMGAVEFQGRLGKDNVIKCHMGSITVRLAAGHPAVNLDADWKMGSLQNDLPFSGESGDRFARGVVGKGQAQGQLRLSANMGSIAIK